MPRRTVLVGSAAAVLSVVLLLVLSPQREPRYQGRTLSEWLVQVQTNLTPIDREILRSGEERPGGYSSEAQGPINAVREIGARAVPELLGWIKRPAPLLDEELRVFRRLVPGGAAKSVPARNRADLAVFGFRLLGPRASVAASELARLMKARNVSQQTRESAMAALAELGPAGLVPLLDAFADPYQPGRRLAATHIGSMHHLGTNAPLAVALLVRLLKEADEQIAGRAATALGDLALEPALSIPGLTNALADPRPFVRVSAISALWHYRLEAQPAIPALTRALTDPKLQVRVAATNALSEIRRQN
jgi:HEAT repeat protein